MEFFTRVTNNLGQSSFDIHVHVFTSNPPIEALLTDFGHDLIEPLVNKAAFLCRENANVSEHVGVSAGTLYVVSGKTSVKCFGRRKALHEGVGGLGKTATPKSTGRVGVLIRVSHVKSCWLVDARCVCK